MKRRRYLILIVGLLILAVIGTIYKANKTANKPCVNCNIMLIDIDILRADALPCFGYSRNTAPNICALAKKSVLFKDNYSTATWTLPSIFSTITSLYPTFHGVRTESINELPAGIPTLAEVLQKKGYQTIFFYEKDEGGFRANFPNRENGGLRGYDQYITGQPIEKVLADLSKTSKPWFIHYYNSDLHFPYLIAEGTKPIDKKMVAPKKLPLTFNNYESVLNQYLEKHYTEVFKKKAIDEYDYIILASVTYENTKVVDIMNKLTGEKNRGEYLKEDWKPKFNAYLETFDQKNSEEVAYVRMMYDTNVKLVDEGLKKVLQRLETKPLAKNTITVLMSDHGEAFGEHGTFAHEYNYHTELFKTPLIIYSPNLLKKTVERPTGNVDIFPTLLELVGIDKVKGLQGQSLVSNINPNRFVLSEAGYGEVRGIVLQNKNWLYFLPKENPTVEQSELYDKVSDQAEKNNVVSQHPELTQSLYKQAVLLLSYETKTILNFSETKLDPEKVKRLQKEGYF